MRMDNKYNKQNIPYDGDINKAMAAKDRAAIRFLMARRSQNNKKTIKEDTECMICREKYNKGRRRKILCPSCQKGCCEKCFRECLLKSSASSPECVGCKHKFSLEFVALVTPKSFHNCTYRRKRANDLLSQERSLLPATQYLVEDAKEKIKRDAKIHELMEEAYYLRDRLREISTNIRTLHNQTSEGTSKKDRKKFIMGCPGEDCRGFLSSAWKCGTCGIYVCSKCRIVKTSKNDEQHVCKDDDVATAKMLSKETKPCPKCAVPIFKISGCDQMWCIECQTPFSWNTGQRVTGIIHNPHFYQWQRQNNGVAPRNGERYDCGGMPWVGVITELIKIRGHFFPMWLACHRSIAHIRGVIIPLYPLQIGVEDHSDLRLKFLLNDINEDIWLSKLRRRQKKVEKNQEVHHVLDMYAVTMTDIFQRFTRNEIDLAQQSHALREYVNTQLLKISKRYNNVVPFINDTWTITTQR